MIGGGAFEAAAPVPAPGELLLDRPLAVAPPPPGSFPGTFPAAMHLLRGADRFPGLHLAGFAELVLIGLIGLQCISLYIAIVTHPQAPRAAAAERPARSPSAALIGHDPFFGAVGEGGSPAIAATDLKLHGVRQDGLTGGGSAIISQADGPQRSFGIGESISPGLVLKAVGPGYATVARHGVDERLAFADFDPPASQARPPDRSRSSTGPMPAASPPASPWPPPRPGLAPAGKSPSINFADPSTLPASLTEPIATTESSGKPSE